MKIQRTMSEYMLGGFISLQLFGGLMKWGYAIPFRTFLQYLLTVDLTWVLAAVFIVSGLPSQLRPKQKIQLHDPNKKKTTEPEDIA